VNHVPSHEGRERLVGDPHPLSSPLRHLTAVLCYTRPWQFTRNILKSDIIAHPNTRHVVTQSRRLSLLLIPSEHRRYVYVLSVCILFPMFTLCRSSPIAAAFLRTSTPLTHLRSIYGHTSRYREQRTTVLSTQNALPHHVPDPPLWDALEHTWQSIKLDNTPRIMSYAPSLL